MTTQIKRINPHRAFTLSANLKYSSKVKRITLSNPQNHKTPAITKPVRTTDKPSAWFLVVTHSDKGLLNELAFQCIASAAILANKQTGIAVLVMGQLFDDLSLLGADEVIVRPDLDFNYFQPNAELACSKAAITHYQPQHIFMPDSPVGDDDLGRRLIVETQKTAATKVIGLSHSHVVCARNNGRTCISIALPEIILISANIADTELPFIGKATRTSLAVTPTKKSTYQDLGLNSLEIGQAALEEADFVVSAGNGVSHTETLKTLATMLNASVGASRVAVDDGKFSREQQVGATGKTLSASAYFAIGISGAVQHLQGIKDCRHVIAINTDASAPIVKRADLSIIGDAEIIMQSLIAAIKEARNHE